VGYSLSVAAQNRWEDEGGAGHTSRSSGLLQLEISQTRVFPSSLKTGGRAVWMVYMTSSRRSRGDEAEDGQVDETGWIGHFYPKFTIFVVLDHKDNLVTRFPIDRTPRAGGEVSTQSSLYHPLTIVAF
jgi:hypothetical protein